MMNVICILLILFLYIIVLKPTSAMHEMSLISAYFGMLFTIRDVGCI